MVCAVSDDNGGTEAQVANARLIAAAPELLAALEAIIKRASPNGNDVTLQRITAIASVAIAKATGGAK